MKKQTHTIYSTNSEQNMRHVLQTLQNSLSEYDFFYNLIYAVYNTAVDVYFWVDAVSF